MKNSKIKIIKLSSDLYDTIIHLDFYRKISNIVLKRLFDQYLELNDSNVLPMAILNLFDFEKFNILFQNGNTLNISDSSPPMLVSDYVGSEFGINQDKERIQYIKSDRRLSPLSILNEYDKSQINKYIYIQNILEIYHFLNYMRSNFPRQVWNAANQQKELSPFWEENNSDKEKRGFMVGNEIVEFEKILYISLDHNVSILHTTEKDYRFPRSLKWIEEQTNIPDFIRVHKQYIVNFQWYSNLIDGYIQLKGVDDEIKIGKSYAENVKKYLKKIAYK